MKPSRSPVKGLIPSRMACLRQVKKGAGGVVHKIQSSKCPFYKCKGNSVEL